MNTLESGTDNPIVPARDGKAAGSGRRFSGQRSYRAAWIAATAVMAAIVVSLMTISSAFAQQNNQGFFSIFENVFNFVETNFVDDVDSKTLYEGAMKGMLESLNDPYSAYLDTDAMSDLTDTTSGKFGGVGLFITKSVPVDPKAANQPIYVQVIAPIEDTPGWRAGLKPGDLILAVEKESTADLDVEEVAKRLRGEPGTSVNVTIRRGESLEFPVTLTRAVVVVPTVKRSMIGDTGIAYLRIIQFTSLTPEAVSEALEFFGKNAYKFLIIDLRSDPGGVLQSVVDIAGYFIPDGVIVSTKSRIASESKVYYASKSPLVKKEIPIVLMIDRGSASASEILAGAMKDHDRAFVIGERSFGKGLVQQVFPLGPDSGIKLTMSRYYTPSGVNIDKTGIEPDREVKEPDFTEAETASLRKLIQDNSIPAFIKKHPQPTSGEVSAFIEGLKSGGIALSDRLLERLIRDETNRTDIAPVFDLDYDIVLQAAVDIVTSADFPSLLASVKTLKQTADEKAGSVAAAATGASEASSRK